MATGYGIIYGTFLALPKECHLCTASQHPQLRLQHAAQSIYMIRWLPARSSLASEVQTSKEFLPELVLNGLSYSSA